MMVVGIEGRIFFSCRGGLVVVGEGILSTARLTGSLFSVLVLLDAFAGWVFRLVLLSSRLGCTSTCSL